MSASDLVHTTGDVVIDDTCAGLIRLGDLLLPARLHSWYLQGSHAEQAATGLSDLDLIAVVRGSVTAAERRMFAELVAACKHLAPYALDVTLLSEADLAALVEPGVWKQAELVLYATTLRLSSRLLAGDDLRPALPAISADDLARARMRFPMVVLAGQRGHPALLRYPLDAPLPDDRFLGYTARSLLDRERQRHPSTKRLVHGTGFIATALLAQAGHTDVGSRREAVRRYRAVFDDRWADLLEQVESWCCRAWGYRVPVSVDERQLLEGLCHQALAFENHFLLQYRSFLLRELRHADLEVRLAAIAQFGKVIFNDPMVAGALHAMLGDSSELETAAIRTTLRHYS